ncbi:YqiJ family protein, partial [Escherichia coli]|nr:YqiJ family protein [Escherichia coli]
MTLTLLTAYNVPYLAALTFVLLTGIAELIALRCGHSLSSAMDTPDLPEGLTGEALDWLNIGRIPLLIVLCMLAGFFGISGILLQGLIIHLLQAPAPNILLAPLCLLLTCPLVHRTGRLI